jgi:hypothetical protein
MRRLAICTALALLAGAPTAPAQEKGITVTVTAEKHDYNNLPVCVPLSLPADAAKHRVASLRGKAVALEGQLTAPGLLTEDVKPVAKGLVRRDLHFIVPKLPHGQSLTFTVHTMPTDIRPDPTYYNWKMAGDGYSELNLIVLGGARRKPVMGYWYKAYDRSTDQARDLTYKVFHHLYDPAGQRIVTNGGQTNKNITKSTKLLYPHHRGLMFAYNKITYGPGKGTSADTWHAKPGDTHEEHTGFAVVEGGPVLGRHRVLIDWHGPKNEVFAKEEREVTVYNVPGGTLVQFVTRLKTTGGTVKLNGDPQHAGFQFRAHNDVAEKSKGQTYYLRPDGKGEPGQTRNWDPKTKKGPVNLPWDAMSFVLDGKRLTAAYLNHPRNPGESRWSERDYARFGCYFPYEMTPERPLVATYRVWLQDGEMTGPQVEALHTSFTSPPTVAAK